MADAIAYINENYPKAYYKEDVFTREFTTIEIYNDDMDIIEEIVVDEHEWRDFSKDRYDDYIVTDVDALDINDMVRWGDVDGGDDLAEVTIVHREEPEEGMTFVVARLQYCPFGKKGFTMAVPFVLTKRYNPDFPIIPFSPNKWADIESAEDMPRLIFSPCDWQGWLPSNAKEADKIDWRIGVSEIDVVNINGLPRVLELWEREQRRDSRKRIGEELRKARIAANLSIRDVAEKSGVDKNVISRTEAGRANTGIDTIAAIAAVYGLKIEIN